MGGGPQRPPQPQRPDLARRPPTVQLPHPLPAANQMAGSGPRHPLMGPLYWACADLLSIAPELPIAGPKLPNATDLRRYLEAELAKMGEQARAGGVFPEDILEAQYALIALLDEQLARAHNWGGHSQWQTNPLQFARFGENTAGENFFRRMYALENQPHRIHVLQVYMLCMAAGFLGRYAIAGRDGGIAAVYDHVAMIVARAGGPDVLSPHGEATEARSFFRREEPIVRIGLGIFGTALLLFILFKVVLVFQVHHETQKMKDYSNTTAQVSRKP